MVTGIYFAAVLVSTGRSDEPMSAAAYYQRGMDHEQHKRFKEALADYSKAIELNPKLRDAYFSRSSIYSGHPPQDKRDYKKAVADLTKVLEIAPKDYAARFNRALCHEILKEYDRAIAEYSEVITGKTDFSRTVDGEDKSLAHTHHYRGRVYHWRKGDYEKALADYTKALELDPDIEMVNYRRGQVRAGLKKYSEAREDFSTALRRTPDYPNLLNSLAWLMATCPDADHRDGAKALEYAWKAHEKSGGKDPEILETLAASFAEARQFDDAIQWQKKALQLVDPKEKDRRKDMQTRPDLFAAGKPYRTK
jgi:serine/threonine-protein kinase